MVEIPDGYTARPLTSEDFSLVWDADHHYDFFESEDGDIVTFGHVDADVFVEKANAYARYVTGDDDLEGYDADAVDHVYAVGLEPEGDILFVWSARTDPFAQPITILRA